METRERFIGGFGYKYRIELLQAISQNEVGRVTFSLWRGNVSNGEIDGRLGELGFVRSDVARDEVE